MMSLNFWQRSSLSSKGITMVLGICMLTLGLFATAFLSQQYRMLRDQSQSALETLSRSVAFNSAAAVTFLASDDASFITASTFLVDGGISAAYVTPL